MQTSELPHLPKYSIEGTIGQGTFSSVVKGINEQHRVVAIKKIYSTSSPKRILKEINFLHILGYFYSNTSISISNH